MQDIISKYDENEYYLHNIIIHSLFITKTSFIKKYARAHPLLTQAYFNAGNLRILFNFTLKKMHWETTITPEKCCVHIEVSLPSLHVLPFLQRQNWDVHMRICVTFIYERWAEGDISQSTETLREFSLHKNILYMVSKSNTFPVVWEMQDFKTMDIAKNKLTSAVCYRVVKE